MYFSNKAEHRLYSNIPRFEVNTVAAFPGGFNRNDLTPRNPNYGRKYKMHINKSDVDTSGIIAETVLNEDTVNRLYSDNNSFEDLPTTLANVERFMVKQPSENIFCTTANRNRNSNVINNTREMYTAAGKMSPEMSSILQNGVGNRGDSRMIYTTTGNSNGVVKTNHSRTPTAPEQYTPRFRTKRIHVNTKYSTPTTAEKYTTNTPVSKESYTHSSSTTEADTDNMFMNMLRSRAKMVAEHVSNNPFYHRWAENWKLLMYNLQRTKYLFNRLDESDADIAYVINKGDEVNFRIRDEKRYVPINIYQYVLYHEMAHMSTTELQHTPKFHELLNILSFAAFELGLIDLRRTTKEYWTTNGQPILCRAALADEIIAGADWLIQKNRGHEEYFNNIIKTVENISGE